MEKDRKHELRVLNLRAWAGETDIFPVRSTQDSSLKKNTAFIKRLRTSINTPNISTFVQEVGSLSLHKYLSEIISACYEGICKLKTPAEIAAGVEVVSALHQRFGVAEFTGYLGWHVGRGLSTPDKTQLKTLAQDVREREEKERVTRQRILLRVATELWLVGVLRSLEDIVRPEEIAKGKDTSKSVEPSAKSKATVNGTKLDSSDGEPFPLEVLKDLLGHDREHVNLPLVVIFVKAFAWEVLGLKPRSSEGRKNVVDDGSTEPPKGEDSAASDAEDANSQDPPIVSHEMQQRFRNVFSRYFEDVKSHLLRNHKTLVAQGRRNAEAYVRSGEVFEDRQANYEKQTKAQDKLVSNAQILAEILGEEMPDMKDKDDSNTAGDGSIGLVKAGDYLRGQGDGAGIWEDEDERRFYENLVDVKDRVPAILLEQDKKKKPENDEQVGKKTDPKPAEDEGQKDASASTDNDDQSIAIANKSVGAQVDALLARLPELHSKDAVDEFAIDFCFVNSKASRNRLIKAAEEVPKGRTDLLPLYSRVIATLSKYMPDIAQGVVAYLNEEFRSLQRRKSKDFLGPVRLLNVRYLAELTKFGVVPEHVIFHCFKVCLDDFCLMNIEITSNLLENCGRYLLRNPETSPRMNSFLETLNRKKGATHLGQQERMILENAVYYVNPPERPAIEQKDRTPMELFIRKIVYDDLNKRNVDKITKQIRKLHWEEPEVVWILDKVFSKPGKLRYNNVHLLAVMLGSVYRYHAQFAIAVIDELLDSITRGLEINETKYNQRRIAELKYLGELYVYRMVDSTLIFDTMYKILIFGYEGGMPKPGAENPFDPRDNYFRIRLICILLETCGSFFDKGPVKKKLDFFITFFQYYLNLKEPWDPSIEFVIQDAFAIIAPDLKIITSLEEATTAFSEAVKQNYSTNATEKATEMEELEEDSESDDGADDDDDHNEEEEKSSADELEEGENDEDDSSESEEEHIIVTRQEGERNPELDAEFDRELAKMMADSMDSRKFERKAMFDVPLPMRKSHRVDAAMEDQVEEGPGMMKFSLLSKRGNKQQTRDIDLPADSSFAVAMRYQQQAEKEEQQRIKNLVLNLDLRDENDGPDGGLDKHPQNPYLHPRVDKAGNSRSNQRARKLQLSDVDWT